ncbi:unnamed protein product [Ilex paraguariensis]|uniref:Uncharacterized protein n=1 Tax=Ilex paraguariensis TaxID=185542 RepID=A0ABC8REF8_9AQUA
MPMKILDLGGEIEDITSVKVRSLLKLAMLLMLALAVIASSFNWRRVVGAFLSLMILSRGAGSFGLIDLLLLRKLLKNGLQGHGRLQLVLANTNHEKSCLRSPHERQRSECTDEESELSTMTMPSLLRALKPGKGEFEIVNRC